MSHVKKDANELLDYLVDGFMLKNDAALCDALGVAKPIVSKLRHLRINPSFGFIVKVHKTYGLPIDKIESMISDIPAQGE